MTAELGVRLWTHYNRVVVVSTPPQAMLVEGQIQYWTTPSIGVYGTFGSSISGASTSIFGVGTKIAFLNFTSTMYSKSFLSGVSMMILADAIHYSTVPPATTGSYTYSGFDVRYGGAIYWYLGTSSFLDTTMMISQVSGNFFIAPMIGLGIKF